jgi:hypothetical protein
MSFYKFGHAARQFLSMIGRGLMRLAYAAMAIKISEYLDSVDTQLAIQFASVKLKAN